MESEMKSTIFIAKTCIAFAAGLSVWSAANGRTLDETQSEITSVIPGFGAPMESSHLESYRGGFDLVKNDMKLMGTVANNSAEHVWSGNNVIADGAFSNATGFPMVVQNSGSNVLIQNATIVNVQMQ